MSHASNQHIILSHKASLSVLCYMMSVEMNMMSVDVSRKMRSVLQWIAAIALFLLIAYLPETTASKFSDGVTQRINVSLPTSNCTHISCFTWSECLVGPSQCFSSHSNVTLLSGEYPLHQ